MTRPSDISPELWERADILRDQFQNIQDDTEFVARILMEVGEGALAPARLGLTEVQASVLAFVNDFEITKGHAPSYREIAKGCDLCSLSSVHRLIHGLKKRGYLQMLAAGHRSIAVVGA